MKNILKEIITFLNPEQQVSPFPRHGALVLPVDISKIARGDHIFVDMAGGIALSPGVPSIMLRLVGVSLIEKREKGWYVQGVLSGNFTLQYGYKLYKRTMIGPIGFGEKEYLFSDHEFRPGMFSGMFALEGTLPQLSVRKEHLIELIENAKIAEEQAFNPKLASA